MLEVRKLDENVSAAGQLDADDIAEAARLGFKAIVNNRPDGEGGPEQPSSADNRKAAQAAGLAYHYIPVSGPALTMETVEAFRRAVEDAPGPVLAHCKSGARSVALWGLVEACHKDRGIDDVLTQLERQGYDLWQMRPLFEQLAAGQRG